MRPVFFMPGVFAASVIVFSSTSAWGQAFLGGTPTAFTPQIGIVETGVVNDVQATVSADEKYVTLTMRPQSSTLLALRTFTFQQGVTALGFVGMPPAAAANARSTGAASVNNQQTPWVSARPSVSILQRQGMIQVSRPAAAASTPATGPSGK